MKEYRVIKPFNDKENNFKFIVEGSTYKCNDERAKELIFKGYLGEEIKKDIEYHINEE